MKRKPLELGLLTAALVADGLLGIARPWEDGDSTFADEAELYARAIALVENNDGVKAYNLFLQEGHGPLSETQELPSATTGAYLDMLVDNELLYQEATRQGLSSSDDEVLTFAQQSKAALAAVAAGGSQLGDELAVALASVAGTSFDLETYDTNPEMLDAFRRTPTVGMLRTQIVDAALPDSNARSSEAMEAAVQEVVGQLRADAAIEVFVQP